MLDARARLCREVLSDAGEIAYAWEDHVMTHPRWAQMRTDERMNGIVGVVVGIIEAAVCRSNDPQAHQTLLFAAVAHGSVRKAQQKSVDHIDEEYDAQGKVLVPFLEKKYGEVTAEFRSALEYAIDEARDGSKYGFQNASSATSWDEYVERLAAQSLAETLERVAART